MDIDYPHYINKPLYLSIALITIGYGYKDSNISINVSDYSKVIDWLLVKVDKEVEASLTTLPLQGRGSGLSFVLSRILECNEHYINLHLDFYKYNTTKELFNDFQILKQTIS